MATKQKTVRDYLDALVWDEKPRLDRWLIEYAGAEDTPYVRAVGRAMLIAAVRRARLPGCQFDTMLVLEGLQGVGKSAALRALAVNEDWFTDGVHVGAGSREVIEATAGKWIVELSEISHMGKGDAAALKAFLSAREDTGRPAYQREAVKVPRHFVIIGTTSASEYLTDSTGNRRFWPVHVEGFDIDRLRADRDQLWAEAAAAEASNESIDVPPEVLEQRTTSAPTEPQYAYVVIGDRFGVEFSGHSIEAACAFVSTKLRDQAAVEALVNPSSYRIKRVKAG
jgi:predicted P-loop ATPase